MEGIKRYKQLLRMQINENRFLVISRTIDGKLSMAQQIQVQNEDGNDNFIFIKNAFFFISDKIFDEFRKKAQEIELNL